MLENGPIWIHRRKADILAGVYERSPTWTERLVHAVLPGVKLYASQGLIISATFVHLLLRITS